MITIVTERPVRSIDIVGYGVDSYTDKNGKKVYRVYGVVKPGFRGRLATRDSDVVKDIYVDDTTMVVYRSEDKNEAIACKDMIDKHVLKGVPAFFVEPFKDWLKNTQDITPQAPKKEDDINAN